MTRRVGDVVIVEVEEDDVCELCGKVDELRPYGPNGERICYDCGMLNPEATKAALLKLYNGVESVALGKLS